MIYPGIWDLRWGEEGSLAPTERGESPNTHTHTHRTVKKKEYTQKPPHKKHTMILGNKEHHSWQKLHPKHDHKNKPQCANFPRNDYLGRSHPWVSIIKPGLHQYWCNRGKDILTSELPAGFIPTHLSDVRLGGAASNHHCNLPKLTAWHSHPLHTVMAEPCGGERRTRIWISLSLRHLQLSTNESSRVYNITALSAFDCSQSEHLS